MKKSFKIFYRIFLVLLFLFIGLVGIIWFRHGGGAPFPDRSKPAKLSSKLLEKVADLKLPPGNIAVSKEGRIFFTFHPEGNSKIKVAELVKGKVTAYPNQKFQSPSESKLSFRTVLSLRIDRQQRLWTLDYGFHGLGKVRLLAFDLHSNKVVHQYTFNKSLAPRGSMYNDFQVSPDGRWLYIADASIFAKSPALVVYDTKTKSARRLLEGHKSVKAEHFVPTAQGVKMLIFGIFAIRPGVDSIALDRNGDWLYYASVTSQWLYRVPTKSLRNLALSSSQIAQKVEAFAPKTISDGITTDLKGNIYITDFEHSAIHIIGQDKKLTTLLKDKRLRWPDGLSFGPDQSIYITCSALQHVIMKSQSHIKKHAPYQIWKFKPGYNGITGH